MWLRRSSRCSKRRASTSSLAPKPRPSKADPVTAVRLRVKTSAGDRTIEGSDILVAAGRTPNTRKIGLEQAGIELDARGFVKVDDRLQATAAGVWAMGECAGSPQFTHVALDDFRVVRDNLAGKVRSTRDRLIPYCAFIDPELARVGLDETAAQQQRIAVRVARIPMTSVLRARAIGETRGFMKMLLALDSDRILGFTMLGADAGEVLAVVQTAMLAGLPYTALRDAIFTHPTMAEGLNVLLTTVPPDASARMAARALARWEGEGGRVPTPKKPGRIGDHMSNFKVGYFVGSLSTSSINRLLAKALVRLAPPGLELTEIAIKDLPLYNRDHDTDYPPVARAFKDAIAAVDAVLFVTPEYNRSIPGALKNAIDWASRPYGTNAFTRKPSAVIGTSPGKIGTAIGQQHLRSILGFCNSPQMNADRSLHPVRAGLDH